MTFNPIAAYGDGKLYVIGYNATEPDVMYFRSDTIQQQAAADNSGAAPKPELVPESTGG